MHLTQYAVRYLLSAVGDPASYELVDSEVDDVLFVNIHCHSFLASGIVTVMHQRGRMVACDGCDRWYHVACLSGPVGNSPTDECHPTLSAFGRLICRLALVFCKCT